MRNVRRKKTSTFNQTTKAFAIIYHFKKPQKKIRLKNLKQLSRRSVTTQFQSATTSDLFNQLAEEFLNYATHNLSQ